MSLNRKVPVRTCIGCGLTAPKRDLLRIVRTPDGDVQIDITSKKSGRGAYICKNESCFNKAIKGNKLSKALETDLSKEIVDDLASRLTGVEKE